MAKPKCLKGISISTALLKAIDRFILVNSGDEAIGQKKSTFDELAGDFVTELVKYTKNQFADSDNFYHDDDKRGVILNNFYENCTPYALDVVFEDLEDRLHTVMLKDEIDDLLVEVINSTVDTLERQEIEHNLKLARNRQRLEACTPRKKFKAAVEILASHHPDEKIILAWYNKGEIYKRLNALGYYYLKSRFTGHWSDIPW
jgi:hypothetical protein